jgi:para-nitrobenzyl esterase
VPSGRRPGEALEVYRRDRADAPVRDVLCAVLTDFTFRIPAIRLAEAQLAHHDGVWMYLFGFATPAFGGALGSCHALEIPFVWDNLDAQGAELFVGELDDGRRMLARTMADAWVAFATDGGPAAPGLPDWPRYDVERRATMRFDVPTTEVVDDPGQAERRLWQGLDR